MILDEIGRGTSTFDGISLAWAITEHIHDAIGCRTLFATHYHELVELEKTKPRLRNANVAVRESEGEIVFLHRIVPGGADAQTLDSEGLETLDQRMVLGIEVVFSIRGQEHLHFVAEPQKAVR